MNVNSIVENVIEIVSGKTINVSASTKIQKDITCAKKKLYLESWYMWKCKLFRKNYWQFNSVNPLYLIVDRINWYIGESSGNKYLMLQSVTKYYRPYSMLRVWKLFGIALMTAWHIWEVSNLKSQHWNWGKGVCTTTFLEDWSFYWWK